MRKCKVCGMVFDGDTRYIEIKGDSYCEDCIREMDTTDLLELLDIEFTCIGFPETERC